jgi:hypothetical protein
MSTTAPVITLLTAFLHFTNRVDAETMIAAGIIGRSRTIVDAVYAVAVGGELVPGVQHTLAGERDVAILFTTDIAPDTAYVEEVIWHRPTDLPITDAIIIPAAEADALLDGSADLPD